MQRSSTPRFARCPGRTQRGAATRPHALGNVPTLDALALVASQLDNPMLNEEACVAAVTIAEKLADNRDARVTAVMERVAKITANKELAARANSIARQAKK